MESRAEGQPTASSFTSHPCTRTQATLCDRLPALVCLEKEGITTMTTPATMQAAADICLKEKRFRSRKKANTMVIGRTPWGGKTPNKHKQQCVLGLNTHCSTLPASRLHLWQKGLQGNCRVCGAHHYS